MTYPMDFERTSPTVRAYIAGFLDADGSVSLIRKSSSYPKFVPVISFYNVDYRVIKTIAELLDVKVHSRDRMNEMQVRTQYRGQCVNREKCKVILEGLLPYLLVKRPQAKLVLEAIELMNNRRKLLPEEKVGELKNKHLELMPVRVFEIYEEMKKHQLKGVVKW